MRNLSQVTTSWGPSAWESSLSDRSDPLRQWQKERWAAFAVEGFPTRRQEHWKYTDVSPIVNQIFSLGDFVDQPNVDYSALFLDSTYAFVFVNGYFRPDLSRLVGLPSQIQWMTMASKIREDASFLARLGVLPEYQTPFLILNDALFQEGFILDIPDHMRVDVPLHFIHIMDGSHQPMMAHSRQWIRLGKSADAVIFEEYHNAADNVYFNNSVSQIVVDSNARLLRYKLQREASSAFHIANTMIHQKRDSQVTHLHVGIGAQLSREELYFSLDEPGASAVLWGLTHSRDKQHMDCQSRIDHRVPYGTSQQNYNCMGADHSRTVFNGKVRVHPQARKTAAAQSNKNLLLSLQAEMNAKPELEIYNDDVQCTHGTTVGDLDEQLVSYLQARTLSKSLAQQLLIRAFAEEIISALPKSAVTDHIQEQVSLRLDKEGYHV